MNRVVDPNENETFNLFAKRIVKMSGNTGDTLVTRFEGARFCVTPSDSVERVYIKFMEAHNVISMLIH
jgi:hypothetical protein